MNVIELMRDCRLSGLTVFTLDGKLIARGNDIVLERFKPLLKIRKAEIIDYLYKIGVNDLIRDFIEIDGMSEDDARALASACEPLRPEHEWVTMIKQLDELIDTYGRVIGLPADAMARLHEIRMRQSLASIPASLAWFQNELINLENTSKQSVKLVPRLRWKI